MHHLSDSREEINHDLTVAPGAAVQLSVVRVVPKRTRYGDQCRTWYYLLRPGMDQIYYNLRYTVFQSQYSRGRLPKAEKK